MIQEHNQDRKSFAGHTSAPHRKGPSSYGNRPAFRGHPSAPTTAHAQTPGGAGEKRFGPHAGGEKRPFAKRSGGRSFSRGKSRPAEKRGPMRKVVSENAARREHVIPPLAEGVIRIIPLGGVEEVGRNMTAIEYGDEIFVIDVTIKNEINFYTLFLFSSDEKNILLDTLYSSIVEPTFSYSEDSSFVIIRTGFYDVDSLIEISDSEFLFSPINFWKFENDKLININDLIN